MWSNRIRRRVWVALLLTCAYASPARALDPTKRITQYAHSAWRVQDGFFNGTPITLVQTADGYLWLATSSGLLRFDGVNFVPWAPPHGQRLPSDQIADVV